MNKPSFYIGSLCFFIATSAFSQTPKHKALYNTNSCKVHVYKSESEAEWEEESGAIHKIYGINNSSGSKFHRVYCPIDNHIPQTTPSGKLVVNVTFSNNFDVSKHEINRFHPIGCRLKTTNWSGQYGNTTRWNSFKGLTSSGSIERELSVDWIYSGSAGMECLIGPGMGLISYEASFY
ncbi:hypothetical protein [Aliiglaciecola sp. M165]|uniref:hypothetical protein n=1 Tax=Aliiglaciecola sp. M165 TaxID=2593649 RepID=UPI00117DED2A|nr:hypothetical protein [Aliiglaciecola sp. M165]TRY31412.1 hypothetical protein FM019_11090 [Aliiglaciecola sp. M165]